MPSAPRLLTLVAAASAAAAAVQGFNCDSKNLDGSAKTEDVFAEEFRQAARLEGTNGQFTSARLFTMLQGGTNEPISAIPAAIATKTKLLLGLWCSAGEERFNNELNALIKAAADYCDQGLADLIVGISVGSEDLYRESDMARINEEKNPGLHPDILARYIGKVRTAIKNTKCLKEVQIGHVDTWNAFTNSTNKAVIDAVDWIGADEYPYFEYHDATKPNNIENAPKLFHDALKKIEHVASGKPIWITETGWPVSGKKLGSATASVENAETYYKQVGCSLFGKTNVWWYSFYDESSPSFGIVEAQDHTRPLFDLSCDNAHNSPKSSEDSKASKTFISPSSSSTASHSDTVSGPDVDSSSSTSGSGWDSGSNPGADSDSGFIPRPDSGPISRPDSGSEPNYDSNSGSSAGQGGQGVPPAVSGGNVTSHGGVQPSGSVPGSGNRPSGAVTPSQVPVARGSQLNSPGAAAVAFVLAVALL